MFVSIRRIKAVLDFAQQDISYIFQRLVMGKCNLFKSLPNNVKVKRKSRDPYHSAHALPTVLFFYDVNVVEPDATVCGKHRIGFFSGCSAQSEECIG